MTSRPNPPRVRGESERCIDWASSIRPFAPTVLGGTHA